MSISAGAKSLFEQLIHGGEPAIAACVDQRWSESPLLDFKVTTGADGVLTRDDRKILGTALSAFANSQGGVIVWGVDARKGTDEDADVARDLRPIPHLTGFVADLNAQTPQVASPGVVGVTHYPVPLEKHPESGYIVSYVPEANGDPVMNIAWGEHRYYIRIGSSSMVIEPYMVADRFRRTERPDLQFTYNLTNGGGYAGMGRLQITCEVLNQGRVAATFPACRVLLPIDMTPGLHGAGIMENVIAPYKRTSTSQIAGFRAYLFEGGSNAVIYPSTSRQIATIDVSVPRDRVTAAPVPVRYELYAIGYEARGEVTISADEVMKTFEVT